MAGLTGIRFRDIDERERAEITRIATRVDQLHRLKKDRTFLTPYETAELERLKAIQAKLENPVEVCDPLFVGVRARFNKTPGILGARLGNHVHGVLQGAPLNGQGELSIEAVVCVSLTIGLMIVNGVPVPPVFVPEQPKAPRKNELEAEAQLERGDADDPGFSILSNTAAPEFAALSDGFFNALGKAQGMQPLALLVLPLLAEEGDPGGRRDRFVGSVDAAEFARVMTALVARGTTVSEPQLRRILNQILDRVQLVGQDQTSTTLGIDFSQLDESAASDAVEENVRLYGTMICAAMFDELKVFQVVDTLSTMFQDGTLVTGKGDAGELLYKYWKNAPTRMTEGERKNFYAITMGIPGGERPNLVNREFNDLWLRFVSSATSYVRQSEVDRLLRASLPSAVSHQQVRKAARDLVTNLSAHGYGMALFAASDLRDQINIMLRVLNDESVKGSCGARDAWQVIDHYATTELGGARTSTRFRTLATCGAIITSWLANNIQRIMRPTGPIIDVDAVRSSAPDTAGPAATSTPTDYDLINACELWLADTAISDTRVDEMSQPRESPVMTSKPVQIPSFARDMLEGAGVSLGMALGAGRGTGNGTSRLNLQS